MKSIGVVRKIDELGRIVLPIELRRMLGIEEKDPVEIFVEGDTVMLKKYSESCVFCGQTKNVKKFKGKNLCEKCMKDIAKKQV